MARIHHWVWQLARWGQGMTGRSAGANLRTWHVSPPADPTQPLWLVPAYQRRHQSGDRPLLR